MYCLVKLRHTYNLCSSLNRKDGSAHVPRRLRSPCACTTPAAGVCASTGPTTAVCAWMAAAAHRAAPARPPCASPARMASVSSGPSCLCSPASAATSAATSTRPPCRPSAGSTATRTSSSTSSAPSLSFFPTSLCLSLSPPSLPSKPPHTLIE